MYREKFRNSLGHVNWRELVASYNTHNPNNPFGWVEAKYPDLIEGGADILKDLYYESAWLAFCVARDQIKQASVNKAANSNIDWGGWNPGDPLAAEKLIGTTDAPGLKNLLDNRFIRIKGIEETRYTELGNALARGLSSGDSTDETAKAIAEQFEKSNGWSDMVARTETRAAVTSATLDSYAEGGIEQVEWLTADGGCDICGGYEDMGPVPIGEGFGDIEGPPAHPNCLCVLLPVVSDGTIPLQGAAEEAVDAEFEPTAEGEFLTERPTPARPGLGDNARVSDQDFAAMQNSSAGPFIIGRDINGVPIFNAERQALHDEIIRKAVEGVPASEKPTYNMLGGGPAAGKTTMEKTVVGDYEGKAVGINADKIKEALPEYGKMLEAKDEAAAGFVHEESSYIAKRMQQAAFEREQDIVLDGTGNSNIDSLLGKIQGAKANGYEVNGYYATCPTDEAVARAIKRGDEIGRYVDESVIRSTHESVSRVFPQAINEFDNVTLFDTTVRGVARPIASNSSGAWEILDRTTYNEFLAKGNV